MYHKNYWTETKNTALMLDKNARKGYNEKNKLRKNIGLFDDDAVADSALDYLYAPSNQSKTQGFLKNNGFPTAEDRAMNQRLYGVSEEQNRTRGLLRRTTADILKPDLTEIDRGFLQGIYGDEKGEDEYQNMVSNANRRQEDMQATFRGSQFESGLKPLVPKRIRDAEPDTSGELGYTVVHNLDQERDKAQYPANNKLTSRIKSSENNDGRNQYAYSRSDSASKAESSRKSWIYNAWNHGEDAVWKGLALGVKAIGWQLTSDLLWLAASGSGNTYTAPPGSYASNLAKNDAGINKFVNDVIWAYGTSQNNSNPVIPTQSYKVPLSNGDLGAALHNVKVDIKASRGSNGVWTATVTLTDTFDFTEFKNPFKQGSAVKGLLWLANDIAYVDTKWGLLDPVGVSITYTKNY